MTDANAPTAPRKVKAAERKKQALARRIGGWTFAQIGEELGISAQAAYNLVKSALAETNAKTAEEAEILRRLELERLDTMRSAIWGLVLKGDVQAIDRALRISKRMSELTGIDAPTKIAPTDPTGTQAYKGMVVIIEHDDSAPLQTADTDRKDTA
jgi:DNA-binding CsgD family transcriptional regulator